MLYYHIQTIPLATFEMVIDAGADVNGAYNYSLSPLFTLMIRCKATTSVDNATQLANLIRLFASKGADLNKKYHNDQSIFDMALENLPILTESSKIIFSCLLDLGIAYKNLDMIDADVIDFIQHY
jgi:hypothetical protein